MPTKTTYSISEVATQFQLSVPTLRYYDQQGLIPGLSKNAAGYRQFTAKDLNTLRIVECLKRTGLSIRDIKQFMTLVQAGDSTLSQRLALFQHAGNAWPTNSSNSNRLLRSSIINVTTTNALSTTAPKPTFRPNTPIYQTRNYYASSNCAAAA